MIFLIALSSFLFLFFLILSTANIIRAQQDELQAKIEDRLRSGDKTLTPVHIEKRERMSDLPFLDRLFRNLGSMKQLQDFIKQSGLTISLGSFILSSLLLGCFTFFLVAVASGYLIPAALLGIGAFLLPYFFVAIKRGGRMKRFSGLFPDAIAVMASSLRAGHSLQIAFETVVNESGDIIAQEFKSVLSEFGVGQNFEEALKGILTRVDTPELRLFISAVILQRETGGNLAELLDNLELVIRDRQELKRELKSSTAQARLSGMILSLLPVFVGLVLYFIHRDYVLFFFQDSIGTKLLAGAVIGQMLGIAFIQKIVHIEL